MPFVEGERIITSRERIYTDYHGDPNVPHAENYVDIEPLSSRVLKLMGGRDPSEPRQTVILSGLKVLQINDRKIEWKEEIETSDS